MTARVDFSEKNRRRKSHTPLGRKARSDHAVFGAFGKEPKTHLFNDMVADTHGELREEPAKKAKGDREPG